MGFGSNFQQKIKLRVLKLRCIRATRYVYMYTLFTFLLRVIIEIKLEVTTSPAFQLEINDLGVIAQTYYPPSVLLPPRRAAAGSPTGGSPTGGSPTGGSPTGGSPTGGSPTGGSPTGGSPTGGSPKADDLLI
jgi:hypothetical protein